MEENPLTPFIQPVLLMMGGTARSQVQNDPGVLIGPIAQLFGYIIDFMFNIVYALSVNHSLGFAIILLTLVVRAGMLPLGVKSQKSMLAMQKLNPEVEKIRNKYGASKDPEVKQKMNVEIQALYSKNKVNPLGGCLPMMVQMPFFFGLMYIMNQSYLYVTRLNEIYHQLSSLIYQGLVAGGDLTPFKNLALPHIPQRMLEAGSLDISRAEDMSKIVNRFGIESWEALLAHLEGIPAANFAEIMRLFDLKQSIEIFGGWNLIEISGWAWPGILIPVLAGGTTFISSWLSQQMSASSDPKMKTQQTVMLVVMPIFMGFITVSMPAGVGLYWITSSVFQVAQQVVMNKRAGIPFPWHKIPFLNTLKAKK
jgi:YidC/Oxa1 family membrane protein insertase